MRLAAWASAVVTVTAAAVSVRAIRAIDPSWVIAFDTLVGVVFLALALWVAAGNGERRVAVVAALAGLGWVLESTYAFGTILWGPPTLWLLFAFPRGRLDGRLATGCVAGAVAACALNQVVLVTGVDALDDAIDASLLLVLLPACCLAVWRHHRGLDAGERHLAQPMTAATVAFFAFHSLAVVSTWWAAWPSYLLTELAGLAVALGAWATLLRIRLAASDQAAADAAAEERRRLRLDLHDGTQQSLLAVALMLQAESRRLADEPSGAGLRLAGVERHLRESIEELRQLARGEGTASGDLRAGLQRVLERLPHATTLHVDIAVPLAADRERALYFAGCEAIANAVKHSGAERIDVTLVARPDTATLTVADDGRGGASVTAGGGLAGLEARLEAFGGRLVLATPTARGTTVTITMPTASPATAVSDAAVQVPTARR